MNTTYYIAVDLGASSGRVILGWLERDIIRLEEVHRFENGAVDKNGRMTWDAQGLFREIVTGLKRAGESGRKAVSMGIDTWGVDFVLLDAAEKILGDAVHYRDHRTDGMDALVFDIVDEKNLYARTGIERHIFNSIYQLYAVKLQEKENLAKAETFLMMPEYLNFLLSGKRMNEYTNATTAQLVNAATKDWDWDLLAKLGLPSKIFGKLHKPGDTVGSLRPEVAKEIGYDLEVMLPPTHDTASAVLAMPAEVEDAIYVSSGTWALMGIERLEADCRDVCRQAGFTNEGGYDYRYCFHKNIMGMWIIQNIRKEMPERRTFDEMIAMASANLNFPSVFDVNHGSFLSPKSMSEAIREYCRKNGLAVPTNDGELLACAYNSLAKSYAVTVADVEKLIGRPISRVHIMGGGCQDTLLNRLAAKYTGKDVYAGPVEATAIGNILSQMIRTGACADIQAAREAVRKSFEVRKVEV